MIEIDAQERVIYVIRRHWFVLLSQILSLIGLVLLPGIVLLAAEILPVGHIVRLVGSSIFVASFAIATWALLILVAAFLLWTDYYLDVLIITDKRVFDINQRGLFRRESSAFRIDRIQNITVNVHGVIPTLLDFGNIVIETAGDNREFIAPYIGNPYEVKKILNEMLDTELERSIPTHPAAPEVAPHGDHPTNTI